MKKMDSLFRNLFIMATIVCFTMTLSFSIPSHAQESAFKPKLIPIKLNEKTNDPQALALAKKLDPDFFYIDPNYLGGSPDAKYFAKFIELEKNKKQDYIAVTVKNTPYWCTKLGCPTRIYKKIDRSQWQEILNLQAYSYWYDANSTDDGMAKIIARGFHPTAGTAIAVFRWYGNKYMRIGKK